MNEIYFYFYVFVTFLIAVYLTLKSNPTHKYITFIIAYWILAGSVLNTEYFIIDIKRLPFDLQPNRIILILFTIYLILVWAGKIKNVRVNIKEPKFERYLYLYIFLSRVVTIIHTMDILNLKDLILSSTRILSFLVIYLVLKRTADNRMIETLFKALIIVCIFSSIIGMYQFIFDNYFFRFGQESPAFAGYLRSNGVYFGGYIQNYFLVPAIVLVLFTVRKEILRYSLIALFFIGIIVTFHRASVFSVILILSLYFIWINKKKVWQVVTTGSIIVSLIFLFSLFFIPNINNVKRSPLVQERLLVDTVTGRIALYNMAIKELPESFLFGVGGTKSDVYYRGILSAGGSKKVASGEVGGIHNLYLGMAYFQGFPLAIIFILFLLMSFNYFFMLSKTISIVYFIFMFYIITYFLRNMTQGAGLSTYPGLLLAILLGIGVAVYQKNIDVSRFISERLHRKNEKYKY